MVYIEVVVRVEFNQGVPDECIKWLWANVGEGNIMFSPIEPNIRREPKNTDAWFYERIKVEVRSTNPKHDSNIKYVPTISVKDEKLAILFMLRWS